MTGLAMKARWPTAMDAEGGDFLPDNGHFCLDANQPVLQQILTSLIGQTSSMEETLIVYSLTPT